MRALIFTVACTTVIAGTACSGESRSPADTHRENSAQPTKTRPTASPTPSTPDQYAASIRKSLSRLGTGTVTLTSHENTYKSTTKFRVDCRSNKPLAEFDLTVPGRQGAAPQKTPIVLSGQKLYSRTLGGKKPWYQGKISELESNEFRSANGSAHSPMDFYLANCDQPSLLALFSKSLDRLAEPGVHKATVDTARAADEAKGYAKDFYRYAASTGAEKLRLTVWLDSGNRPTKYQIVSKGPAAPPARWVVSFDQWSGEPIEVPAKDDIGS